MHSLFASASSFALCPGCMLHYSTLRVISDGVACPHPGPPGVHAQQIIIFCGIVVDPDAPHSAALLEHSHVMPLPAQLTSGNEACSTSADHSLYSVRFESSYSGERTSRFVGRIATHHRASLQGEPR